MSFVVLTSLDPVPAFAYCAGKVNLRSGAVSFFILISLDPVPAIVHCYALVGLFYVSKVGFVCVGGRLKQGAKALRKC